MNQAQRVTQMFESIQQESDITLSEDLLERMKSSALEMVDVGKLVFEELGEKGYTEKQIEAYMHNTLKPILKW